MLNLFEIWGVRLVVVLLLVFYQPAMAQTGDWHHQEGGRIRISFDSSPRGAAAGEAHGLIEVALADGWKTYWKDPGSSGMAPELEIIYFDSAHFDSDRLREATKLEVELMFPPPRKLPEKKGDGWIYGYQHGVHLPFRLTLPTKAGKIVGHLLIGLCDDVCMPVMIDFAFDLEEKADFLTKGRIEAALAALS